jgi:hypothetical protein
MKQDLPNFQEVTSLQPRRAGVGAALRSLFVETNAASPVDFEALLAELDARTRCRT